MSISEALCRTEITWETEELSDQMDRFCWAHVLGVKGFSYDVWWWRLEMCPCILWVWSCLCDRLHSILYFIATQLAHRCSIIKHKHQLIEHITIVPVHPKDLYCHYKFYVSRRLRAGFANDRWWSGERAKLSLITFLSWSYFMAFWWTVLEVP